MKWTTDRDWKLRFAWFPVQCAYDEWVWWEPYEVRKPGNGTVEYRRPGSDNVGVYGPD
jgi:hypothetical protein